MKEKIKEKAHKSIYSMIAIVSIAIIGKFSNYLIPIITIVPFIFFIAYLYKVKKVDNNTIKKVATILFVVALYNYNYKFSNIFLICMFVVCISFAYIKKIRELKNRNKIFMILTGSLLILNIFFVKGLI